MKLFPFFPFLKIRKNTLAFFYYSPLKKILSPYVSQLYQNNLFRKYFFAFLDSEAEASVIKFVARENARGFKPWGSERYSIITLQQKRDLFLKSTSKVLLESPTKYCDSTDEIAKLSSKDDKNRIFSDDKHQKLDTIILDFEFLDFNLIAKKILKHRPSYFVTLQSWLDIYSEEIAKFQETSPQNIMFESCFSLLDETTEYADQVILEVEQSVEKWISTLCLKKNLSEALKFKLSDLLLSQSKEKLVLRRIFRADFTGNSLLLSNSEEFSTEPDAHADAIGNTKRMEIHGKILEENGRNRFPTTKQYNLLNNLVSEKIIKKEEELELIKQRLCVNNPYLFAYFARESEIPLFLKHQEKIFDGKPNYFLFNKENVLADFQNPFTLGDSLSKYFSSWTQECLAQVALGINFFKRPMRGIDTSMIVSIISCLLYYNVGKYLFRNMQLQEIQVLGYRNSNLYSFVQGIIHENKNCKITSIHFLAPMLGARIFTPKVDRCVVLSDTLKQNLLLNYQRNQNKLPSIRVLERKRKKVKNENLFNSKNRATTLQCYRVGFALKRFSSKELAKYITEVTNAFLIRDNVEILIRFHPNQRINEIRQIISLLNLFRTTKICISCSSEEDFFKNIDCLFLLRGTMVQLAKPYGLRVFVYKNINYTNFESNGVEVLENEKELNLAILSLLGEKCNGKY